MIDYQTEFGLGAYTSYTGTVWKTDVCEGIRLNDTDARLQGTSNDLKAETGDSYEFGLRYLTEFGTNSNLVICKNVSVFDYYDLIAESSSAGSAFYN